MSQQKIEALKAFLESQGFIEGEDFSISGGEDNTAVISVSIPLDEVELPEPLQPFAEAPDQVERAIWKGNAEKRTFNGANFEIALGNYVANLMDKDPEAVALRARLDDVNTLPRLQEYRAERQRIWERICSTPEIVAWEKDLKENYL